MTRPDGSGHAGHGSSKFLIPTRLVRLSRVSRPGLTRIYRSTRLDFQLYLKKNAVAGKYPAANKFTAPVADFANYSSCTRKNSAISHHVRSDLIFPNLFINQVCFE